MMRMLRNPRVMLIISMMVFGTLGIIPSNPCGPASCRLLICDEAKDSIS